MYALKMEGNRKWLQLQATNSGAGVTEKDKWGIWYDFAIQYSPPGYLLD
ncbi:hypothetical protein [Ferruginibacter profundus]